MTESDRRDAYARSCRPVNWFAELGVGIAVTLWLVFVMKSALLQGQTTLAHDNLYWAYPIYHVFAEALQQGHFPWWNPFTHAGEPFYPLVWMARLLDPSPYLVLWIGSYFTDDLITLFNWHRFIYGLIIGFGTCLFLREYAEHWLARLAIIPVVMLSSFHLVNFRQNAMALHFVTAPYVLLLVMRILCHRDNRWRMWLALSVLLGLNMQGYFFAGIWTFLLLLFVGIFIFQRDLLQDLWSMAGLPQRLVISGVIIGVMCLPSLVLMLEKDEFIYPARMVDSSYQGKAWKGTQQFEPGPDVASEDSIMMPYSLVAHTGTFSRVADFIQIMEPYGNVAVNPRKNWGNTSEAFMYFGLLTWAGALYGLVRGRHPMKRVWIVVAVGMALLLLGPIGGLHPVLFHICPPLWFIRHTHGLMSFFCFAVLFFFVLGCNALMQTLFKLPDSNHSQGEEIRSVLRNPWLWIALQDRWAWPLILGGGLFVAGYTAERMENWGPQGVLKGSLLILSVVAVGLYRMYIGKRHLFAVLLGMHIALAMVMVRARTYWGITVVLGLLVPMLLIRACSKHRSLSPNLVAVVLLAVLTLDLSWYLFRLKGLGDTVRPDAVLRVSARPSLSAWPEARTVFPPKPKRDMPYEQSLRYSEPLHRTISVFAPLMHPPESFPKGNAGTAEDRVQELQAAISQRRWNSFIMSKHYYDLIYSGLPPEALLEIFDVGLPRLQFKPRSMLIEDISLRRFADRHSSAELVELLRTTVLLSPDPSGVVSPEDVLAAELSRANAADDVVPASLPSDSEFVWNIVRYDDSDLLASVTAPRKGYVYWADGYNQHWRAYVDGVQVPVHRANVNFKAVEVMAGKHEIRFVFDPASYKVALAGFMIMCGVLYFGIPLLCAGSYLQRRVCTGKASEGKNE